MTRRSPSVSWAQTLSLLACSAAFAGSAPATQSTPRVLISQGDQIAGATLTDIRSIDVDGAGRWAAVVELQGVGAAALLDGVPLAIVGQSLPGGDIPTSINRLDVDEHGRWALRYATANHPMGRLMIDGAVALSAGDSVDAFNIGPGAVAARLRTATLRAPYLLVTATVEAPLTAPYDAAFLYMLQGSTLTPVDMLVRTGSQATAPGLVEDLISLPALGPTGDYLVPFTFNGAAGSDLPAGDFNGGAAFVTGTTGPGPGTSWAAIGPRVAVGQNAGYAVGGTVRDGPSPAVGVVVHGGAGQTQLLAQEGQPFPPRPGTIVGDFHTTDVDMTDNGQTFFFLPIEGGPVVLTDGASVFLEEADLTSDGSLVTRLFVETTLSATGRPDTVYVSPDGRFVHLLAELDGGRLAVLEMELEVGQEEPCASVPNSTGAVARLGATGSSALSENRLRLVGSRLPSRTFAAPLVADGTGFLPAFGGGQGTLCLGGALGVMASQVALTDSAGSASFDVDLSALPTPSVPIAAALGETWRFQLWHRDAPSSSNLSGVLAVQMR